MSVLRERVTLLDLPHASGSASVDPVVRMLNDRRAQRDPTVAAIRKFVLLRVQGQSSEALADSDVALLDEVIRKAWASSIPEISVDGISLHIDSKLNRCSIAFLRLFFFLHAGDSGDTIMRIKLCEAPYCNDIFVDRSRAGKAHYCSSTCRTRAWREASA